MESLNMNNLVNSLPNSANAERQLMDNFKAAALSITTLYRSSLDTSKRAYSAGYATGLLDVLRFVEAGVSVSGTEGEEMTIGRVMDWLEARLEAIKSTEEEEEEERLKDAPAKTVQEESQRDDRERRSRKNLVSVAATTSRLHRRSKENLYETSQTGTLVRTPASPPARYLASPSPPPPLARPVKQRRGLKELSPSAPISTDVGPLPVAVNPSAGVPPFTFSADVVSAIPAVGAKRRHATMIAESPASSSVSGPSPPIQGVNHSYALGHTAGRRKRNRGTREREAHQGGTGNGNVNANAVSGPGYTDAMDVEEEGGRERKRIARR